MKSFSCAVMAATLVVGCGDVVGLGNVAQDASTDAFSTSSPPGSPEGGPPSGEPDAGCAGIASATELLLDTDSVGGAEINDFAGDGRRVYVAINLIAGFQAGRILDLPHRDQSNDVVVNVSPSTVGNLGLALGHVAYDATSVMGARQVHVVARDGKSSASAPTLGASLMATHPSLLTAAYVEGSFVDLWTVNPSSVARELVMDSGFTLTSLAMNGQGSVIALAEGTAGIVPTLALVRKPLMPGSGPYSTIARATARALSNIAMDDKDAYFVMQREGAAETLVRIPLDGSGLDPAVEHVMGTLPELAAGMPARARVLVTDTHVYVDRGLAGPCAKGACTTPLTLVRVAKTAPGTIENVSTFTGPSAQSDRRAFYVDACYLTWSDGSKLWRKGYR